MKYLCLFFLITLCVKLSFSQTTTWSTRATFFDSVRSDGTYDTTGWTFTQVDSCTQSNCNNEQIVGGYGCISPGGVMSSPTITLPTHQALKISFRAFYIDSWDPTNLLIVKINDQQVWVSAPYAFPESTTDLCGVSGWPEKVKNEETIILPHTDANIVISFETSLDQPAQDESFGFRNLVIQTPCETCPVCDNNNNCFCSAGYFYNSATTTCDACDLSCKTCQQSPLKCLTCDDTYSIKFPYISNSNYFKCYQFCPSGFVRSAINPSICLCELLSSCQSSVTEVEYAMVGKSTSQCAIKLGMDNVTNKCRQCNDINCLNCDSNYLVCRKCAYNTYLTKGNYCQACHSSCLSCQGPLETDCLACPGQFQTGVWVESNYQIPAPNDATLKVCPSITINSPSPNTLNVNLNGPVIVIHSIPSDFVELFQKDNYLNEMATQSSITAKEQGRSCTDFRVKAVSIKEGGVTLSTFALALSLALRYQNPSDLARPDELNTALLSTTDLLVTSTCNEKLSQFLVGYQFPRSFTHKGVSCQWVTETQISDTILSFSGDNTLINNFLESVSSQILQNLDQRIFFIANIEGSKAGKLYAENEFLVTQFDQVNYQIHVYETDTKAGSQQITAHTSIFKLTGASIVENVSGANTYDWYKVNNIKIFKCL